MKPCCGNDVRQARFAFGQRAGLVDDERVDLFHPLDRFGVFDQHAGLRAASDADHDRHRRGESERARTGDDQHGDRIDDCVREARLRSEPDPRDESEQRDREDRRHKPAGHLVGQPLNRRAAALRLRDHLDDLREHGVAADALGFHEKLPVPLTVPPVTLSPVVFSTGIDSPVSIDSSTFVRPSMTRPSTGTFSPGRTRS